MCVLHSISCVRDMHMGVMCAWYAYGCVAKICAGAGTRTHDLLRIRRALCQLRQSSTFWGSYLLVLYINCVQVIICIFFGRKLSIYSHKFFILLHRNLFFLSEGQLFLVSSKSIALSDSKFFRGWFEFKIFSRFKFFDCLFCQFFQVVYLLNVEWLSDQVAYVEGLNHVSVSF